MARAFLASVAVALGLLLAGPANAVVPSLRQPTWAELTPEQKQILAPLAMEWDKLESYRQMKWLGIAQRYPSLKPEEQARVQRRMKDWVKLSPEERKAAREKYKKLQKASPERKETLKQKWEEYKQLPEDERQRLADEAAKAELKRKMAPGKPRIIPKAAPVQTPTVPAASMPAQPTPADATPAPAPQTQQQPM